MKSKTKDLSHGSSFVAERLKTSLLFTLVSSGASLVMFFPLLVSASVFSIPAFIQSLINETSAAGSNSNSQTVSLLSPATNIDPRPSVGGGDITLVGGTALLSENGPSGTQADVETAPPEATSISVYTVHKGDTLGGIAKMFGVTVNTIVWANEIKGPLREGQQLVILPIAGVRHTVVKGDTVAALAKKYKADQDEIVRYNSLDVAAVLEVGSTVIIPDGERTVVNTAAAKPAAKKPAAGSNYYKGGAGPDLGSYYAWPVQGGLLTQGLHGYNGVDIGAPSGTAIVAAAAGTVIVANGGGGWNGGYGNYLVIQHDNGTQTLYAHAHKLYVSAGTRVEQGQAVGAVGRTGKATGSHLHFEVRGATNPFGIGLN